MLTGERVLVTGAAGYIGRRLVARLLAEGAVPVPLTRGSVDLSDRLETRRVLLEARPDAVVHLAANLGSRSHATAAPGDNVPMTLHVLEALSQCRPRAFLHLGTLDEYGDGPTPFAETQNLQPLTTYAADKAAAGLYWTMTGGLHVRVALVYGPGQDQRFFIPQLLQRLDSGEPFAMTAGEQVRDLIYIDDVIEGVVRLLAQDKAGQAVNLCTGQGHALKEVVSIAQKVAGRMGCIQLGGLAYRPREVFRSLGATNRLEALTGWCPQVALEPGLRLTHKARVS